MSDYPRHSTSKVKVGDKAPDFTLNSHSDGEVNLGWYAGRKNVVLAFYPADWTPVCTSQMPSYSAVVDRFDQYDCQILGISVDSVPCHIQWAKSLGGLSFPLLADFFPHGGVAEAYGVLKSKGYAERAIFIIDKFGIIQHIEIVNPSEMPDEKLLFEQLAALPEGPKRPDDYLRK
ncbi:MAG: redoxin domain-containing protein [candidate division Zixibacteria bacterium]